MKIGIYIDGLGQSIASQSVIDYASRFKNEIASQTDGIKHELKIAKVNYIGEKESTVVSIIEQSNGAETTIYKLYDFGYSEILTAGFNKKNIIVKNILLLSAVIKKFPILIYRLFKSRNYNRPFQTFYIFSLFLVIAAAILFMVPNTINVIINFLFGNEVKVFVNAHPWMLATARFLHITYDGLKHFSELFVSIIAIVLLLVPKANTIIISLASEFVCAHNYLQYGQQKQDILGNLNRLMEYIAENEKDAEVHFHAYSYGSLVAIDYLFPYGDTPSGNMLNRSKALITIGTPFDFISSYYRGYYLERNNIMDSKIKWLNVFSVSDALGSNFRKDNKAAEAEYGVSQDGLKPTNINYEVVRLNEYSLVDFIFLTSLKVHGMYWSEDINGNSCLNLLYLKMKGEGLI